MNPYVKYISFLIALFLIWEGIRAYRNKASVNEFFLYGGKLKIGGLVSTLVSTNLSLGNFVILASVWGYFYGASGGLWLVLGFVAFVFGFLWFAPTMKAYVEDGTNSGTLHEFLSISYAGKTDQKSAVLLRLIASTATIICLLFALTLELHLVSLIFLQFMKFDQLLLITIMTALICAYAAIGGYRAVVVTDIVQAFLHLAAIAAIVYLVFFNKILPISSYGSLYELNLKGVLFDVGWCNIVSMIVLGFGWFLVAMDNWQRSSATRSIDLSKGGVILGSILLSMAIIFWVFVGVYDNLAIRQYVETAGIVQQHSGGLNPISDLFILADVDNISFIISMIAVGLVMAALSTADTFLMVCGHSLVSDIMIGIGKKASFGSITDDESKAFTNIGRAVIVMMGLMILLLWKILGKFNLLGDPLTLFYIAYTIQFSLLAPLVFLKAKKRPSANAAILALIAGITVSLCMGISSAMALQRGVMEFASIRPDQWLALTPVVTVITGSSILFVSTWKNQNG